MVVIAAYITPRAREGRVGRAAVSSSWRVVESSVSSGLMSATISRAPVLCLASVSPRRRALLSQIGVEHIIAGADIDETVLPGEAPRAYVSRLAREKALCMRRAGQQLPVLAADTTVVVDGIIFGKPRDREHAAY